MEIHRADLFNFNKVLLHSLGTIQTAKTQFHLLTARSLTPTVLVSQIRLCDVLLGEIRAISCRLERRMRFRAMTDPRCVVARRDRGCRHLAVQQGYAANRSRRKNKSF